ncbi:MAG TPA: hypothetical protein VGA18_02285, partial [Rhodothermales bacterium]
YYLGRIDSIIWGTVMARRSLYELLLPFDARYRNWADVDMWMRFCGAGSIAFAAEQLIELDSTETLLRRFSFRRARLVQEMAMTNIARLFIDYALLAHSAKQRKTWKRLWWRWMAGGVLHGEWARLCEGLGLARSSDTRAESPKLIDG